MKYVDSHCHLHDTEFFPDDREQVYADSIAAGVSMICVGTDVRSSREAIDFAQTHDDAYAIIGIHPHDAKDNDVAEISDMLARHIDTVVGIGEIGLDYFYTHSPRHTQQTSLRAQLQLAQTYELPVSFHVRDTGDIAEAGAVWNDFWPILDEFPEIRGVLHSFTDNEANLQQAVSRGLYIGVNGISTFTKDETQQNLYKDLPLENMLLETDAPFLTPVPFRGTMNKPAYVERVAEHQAELKSTSVDDVARVTTANAKRLFGKIL